MDSVAAMVAVAKVLDLAEEEADLELTVAELDFTEGVPDRDTWESGQCSACGHSNLNGIGSLCLDCEVYGDR
jgi:hypothetical protein